MQVEILERETCFQGFFRLDRYRLRHGLFAGGMSESLRREVFERGHSVGVLPYDPELDAVVLIEQFRVGALEHPGGPWLFEVVAGILETGEPPRQVAEREMREETGGELSAMIPVCEYLVSPGGTSERTTLFCGRASAEGLAGRIQGVATEGEDIRVHVVPFEQAMEMIQDGIINSAMPIIALQWLALNKERVDDLWTD